MAENQLRSFDQAPMMKILDNTSLRIRVGLLPVGVFEK
jgi:hypothetical protein